MVRTAIVLIITLFLLPRAGEAASAPVSKITISNLTKQQYLDMVQLGLDIVEAREDAFEILADAEDKQALQELGIPFDVEVQDLQSFYAARAGMTMGGFKTYNEIITYLDNLVLMYPNLISPRFSIGTTYEGRDIWALKISDNHAIDEDEPEVFYNSLIHAREPAGAAALLNVMEHLLVNYGIDPDITYLVDNREMYFVPVVNPDGYLYNQELNPFGGGLWRKNRRPTTFSSYGIDLNRNFGFAWGYDDFGSSSSPGSDVYRGPGPFSEPETEAIRDFVASRQFVVCNNIHTYSNLFLWPYGYDRIYSHMDDFYNQLGDSVHAFNGYTAQVAWLLYPTNGAADDWMWGDTITKPRVISVTTEIGNSSDGFWPDPARIPALVAENLEPNLFLARIADNPYQLAPPNRPTVALPDSVGLNFALHWQVQDSINPPTKYAVTQLTGKSTVTDMAEATGSFWSRSRMNLSTVRKHSGNSSWKTANVNGKHHWLLSNMPYQVKENDSLRFWTWYDVEDGWDYFYAQVSVDGGYSFINLPGSTTTNTNPNNMNLGDGMTGSSGGWVRLAFDLAPYTGQQVLIRLALFTDGYTLGEGVYIDDIENVDMFTSSIVLNANIADTSWSFTSKTPGQYWYRVTATDAQGQESRPSDLYGTTVYVDYIIGDLNGSRVIDGTDLAWMISYMIYGQPVPQPLTRANVNCAGIVDGSDLAYMIAYLTAGAPKPSCP